MTNKSVLLVGFYGEGNLGDNAILQGMMSALPPEADVIATSGRNALPCSVKRIERRGLRSWPSYLCALKKACLVVGSGGLLQDWSFEGITFYALRFLAAGFAKKPTALFGAGIGPVRSVAGKRLAAVALRKIKEAYLRDDESTRLFYALTGRPANRGADWSWALQADLNAPDKSEKCGFVNSIAINIRPWFDGRWSDFVCNRLENSKIEAYVGIPAREEDARLMKSVVPKLHIYTPLDFSQLTACCKYFKEAWAMRYHVILALLRANVPIIALPYDEKVRRLAIAAGVPFVNPESNECLKAVPPSVNFMLREEGYLKAMIRAFKRLWESL